MRPSAIFVTLLSLLTLIALGCASTQAPAPTRPLDEGSYGASHEANSADTYGDPETRRFVEAYTRLFCKANHSYDPDSTVSTLREPISHMKRLKEGGSDLLVGYMAVLTDTGFESLGAFDNKAATLRADEAFWSELQTTIMDGMSSCK
jgi:hypothetical protein